MVLLVPQTERDVVFLRVESDTEHLDDIFNVLRVMSKVRSR